MSVDQAAYRPYEGTRRPGHGVVFAIAETSIRRVMRQKWIRSLTLTIVVINVAIGAIMNISLNTRIRNGMTVGDMIENAGGGDLDAFVMTLRGFLSMLYLFAPVIAALTAGPLIAEDRRARALPLYFSRPIRHWQYVAGKMIAAGFFLAAMTLLPPFAVFGMEIANAPDMSQVGQRFGELLGAWVPCVLITVALASFSLGISSLMDRTTAASMLVFCVVIFPVIAVNAAYGSVFTNPAWLALDPFNSIVRIGHELLPPTAGQTIDAYDIPLANAWQSLAGWTAAGLLMLGWRIRNVEVVT